MPKPRHFKLISLDTETTGVDLHHGAKPFLVTIAHEDGTQLWWEWEVDPLTRQPFVDVGDLAEIEEEIQSADKIVLQNPKFDVAALHTLTGIGRDEENGVPGWLWEEFPWEKVEDTLLAGHLLASNRPHNLTDMSLECLNVNIEPLEKTLEKIVIECRNYCRKNLPTWRIAKEGLPEMPSVKDSDDGKKDKKGAQSDKAWKNDMWLPRALADHLGYGEEHEWRQATPNYANTDSAVVIPLHKYQLAKMRQRGIEPLYRERLKVLKIANGMESRGITINGARQKELKEKYVEESTRAKASMVGVAKSYGYDLVLPKSGNNNSLKTFVFDVMKLPIVAYANKGKSKNPALDKFAIDQYKTILPVRSKQYSFVNNLSEIRSRDTAVSFLEGYERFWLPLIEGPWVPVSVDPITGAGWYVLHPSLNPTGTDTLRWSSSNPNSQNISKKEGFNLRYCFGPAPGREWWSNDAKNIEARLPAYESGEAELIALYEHPDEPPYYGSGHFLNFHTVYPEIWNAEIRAVGPEKVGAYIKKKYAATNYQWVKNGGFAVQYGAIEVTSAEKWGTADKAFHRKGAHSLLKNRFSRLEKLNQEQIDYANRHGYVETIPDKTVCPEHGYPLMVTRNQWGRILETVPLNYHIQGTAMWWTMKAMIRCEEFLDKINNDDGYFREVTGRSKTKADRTGFWLAMQVHDELVFDFPKGTGDEPWRTNKPIIERITDLMAEGGNDIGYETPVGCEYHEVSWDKGISV